MLPCSVWVAPVSTPLPEEGFQVLSMGDSVLNHRAVTVHGRVVVHDADAPRIARVGFAYTWTAGEVPTTASPTAVSQPYAHPLFSITSLVQDAPSADVMYYRLFAIDATSVVQYSEVQTASPFLCLPLGTSIAVWHDDGAIAHKPIEALWYSDNLVTWDHARGALASARPLWLMRRQWVPSPHGHALHTRCGAVLHTVGAHRVFVNRTGDTSAAYVPVQDVSAAGCTCMVLDAATASVHLCPIDRVTAWGHDTTTPVFNVLSASGFLNVFANGVLTSCRYSNREDPAPPPAMPAALSLYQHLCQGLLRARDVRNDADATYVDRLVQNRLRGVVFVDHDGVMADAEARGPVPRPFSPDAVQVLNAFLQHHAHGVDVVVSSDWKDRMTLGALQAWYAQEGVAQTPIDVTPTLWRDSATTPAAHRCAEIRAWLHAAAADGHAPAFFLVLDDLDTRPVFGPHGIVITGGHMGAERPDAAGRAMGAMCAQWLTATHCAEDSTACHAPAAGPATPSPCPGRASCTAPSPP